MLSLKRNLPSFYLLSFLFLAFGFYQAYKWQWICDDAYISFVYARNLSEGLGLVFHLGERVEGYTNFLWTIVLSLGDLVGIKPQTLSIGTGIFFYLSTLFVFLEKRIDLHSERFIHF